MAHDPWSGFLMHDLSLFGASVWTAAGSLLAALSTNLLSFFVGFGALLFIAQYLQLVVGLSPLQAGLCMLPSSVGFILGSLLTPLLAHRVRPVVVMAGGLVVAAVGFLLLTRLDGASGLAVLVIGSVVFSLGLAPVDTLAADLAVGAAPTERAGAAAALSETAAELGGALGIAILGVVGTAAYRGRVADAIPAAPAALPWSWRRRSLFRGGHHVRARHTRPVGRSGHVRR